MDAVLKKVLKKITPIEREREDMKKVLDTVLSVSKKIIKPLKLEQLVAGSFARDTWMRHKKEFDLFILFPESYSWNRLEKKGLEIGKKIVKELKGSFEIAYAEHPYVRAEILEYDVDIVPCYKITSTEKMKSSVDRTPFHSKWLKRNFKPRMSDQVRLLKQFTKTLGVYGSDTKTQGMSGYLCELLIFHYKTFKSFVKNCAKWKSGEVFIDIKKYHPKQEIRSRFKDQPLIVIDPVDKKRNVAAVMSPENIEKLVSACRMFVKKPSERFFFKREKKIDKRKLSTKMNKRGSQVLAITFKRPKVIDDVLYPQLRRTGRRLADILKEYEFAVLNWGVYSNDKDSIILIELETWKLPNVRIIFGPKVFAKKHVEEFKKKYKPKGRLWVEGEYWLAEIPRTFRDADVKLKDTLSDPVKELRAKGIASYIAKSVSKNFSILKTRRS